MTPIGILSGGFDRNANPSASARRSGNPKTQNIASVSRTTSFVRTLVSSISGCRTGVLAVFLSIAQLSSRQRDEEVLERRGVRGQRAELSAAPLDHREKLGGRFRERI